MSTKQESAKEKARPVCYSDGISCPGCPHYHDPIKNPECSYKANATRRTIDDASNEEWLHAAARIAGGDHVEEPDDEISDSDTMSGPIRGEKESALCAVWLAYQTELISEQEVIRQSVALATAADLEISAMRKEIEHLRPTARTCNDYDELRTLLAEWLKVADDALAEARETGHGEYNVTVGLINDTRAALQLAKEGSK